MQRHLLQVFLLWLAVTSGFAQSWKRYEYWIDADYGNKTVNPLVSTDVSVTVDGTMLLPGLHYFNVRVQDDEGLWGPLKRDFFYIPQTNDEAVVGTLVYEYWVDSDYVNRTTSVAQEDAVVLTVDGSELLPGLHYFNVRAQNDRGLWGPLKRDFFYIPQANDEAVAGTLVYEYWVDNDYSNRTTSVAQEDAVVLTVDGSELRPGLHYFNVRAQNENGLWDPLKRDFFYIPQASDEAIAGTLVYEYWVDNDYTNRTTSVAQEDAVVLTVDGSELLPGLHYFNVRAQNENGLWGPLKRDFFYIPQANDEAVAGTLVYEYWVDSDYTNRTTAVAQEDAVVLTVDGSELLPGLHYFNVRAQNDRGLWGPLKRDFFYIPQASDEAVAGTLVYEYWVDNDYSNRTTSVAQDDAVVLTVDGSELLPGLHYFNVRAQNDRGLWGPLKRDFFYIPQANDEAVAGTLVYEYWVDNDYTNRTTSVAQDDAVVLTVDGSELLPGLHYFNVRAQNDRGLWGPLKRDFFYIPAQKETAMGDTLIVGYEYSFGGLATYVPIAPAKQYELQQHVIDIPDLEGFGSLEEGCTWKFATNKVSLSRQNSLSFSIRFRNEAGEWSMPEGELFEMSDAIEKTPSLLSSGQQITLTKAPGGSFEALRLQVSLTRTYYIQTSQSCRMHLFDSNGTLLKTVGSEALQSGEPCNLTAGQSYYAIVYKMVKDEQNPDDYLNVKLLREKNMVLTPNISYENEMVTMVSAQEGAVIYYTIDGTMPTTESTRYTEPFLLQHNATIKAIACVEGMTPSAVISFVVNNYKAAKPVFSYNGYKLSMTTETSDARICYTLDGSTPDSSSTEYVDTISLTKSCTVKAVAVREFYNNSDVAVYQFDSVSVVTASPVIAYEGNRITIGKERDGDAVYYTLDGSVPTRESIPYTSPFEVGHNCVVKAFAVRNDYFDSSVAELEVDWFKVAMPVFSVSGTTLSISCATANASIYYNIGSEEAPSTSSTLYTGPFDLNDNQPVKAIAIRDDYHDSDVALFAEPVVTSFGVAFAYDGRHVTITPKEEDATVFYTIDGTEPTTESAIYQEPITVDRLLTVKARAMRPYTNMSEVAEKELTYVFDGETATVRDAGLLRNAFDWCKDVFGGELGTVVGRLAVAGPLNNDDYATIRDVHVGGELNLEQAQLEGRALPDGALAGATMKWVVMPANISTIGRNALGECRRLAAITWNSKACRLTAEAFGEHRNPNMLFYVQSENMVGIDKANVVSNGRARSISLQDGMEYHDFYCPVAFHTDIVSYTHDFRMKTRSGICQGWEALSLPFNVQTITHWKNGELVPFIARGQDDSRKPFWLARLESNGFVASGVIEAYTPYIISMPNDSSTYGDRYLLGGGVTFMARNVEMPVTDCKTGQGVMGEVSFVPNYELLQSSADIYTINLYEPHDAHPEGSIFLAGYREVRPFEAYTTSTETVRSMIDISDIFMEDEASDIRELYMRQSDGNGGVYNLQGQRLAAPRKGLSIVGGKKVVE